MKAPVRTTFPFTLQQNVEKLEKQKEGKYKTPNWPNPLIPISRINLNDFRRRTVLRHATPYPMGVGPRVRYGENKYKKEKEETHSCINVQRINAFVVDPQ